MSGSKTALATPRGRGYRTKTKSPALMHIKSKNLPGLTPHQVGQLRRAIFDEVEARMHDARLVLQGKKTWSNSQVQLFKALLNKVVPEITHSTQLSVSGQIDPERMSRQQLEELVSGFAVIDADYSEVRDESGEPEEDKEEDKEDGQPQDEPSLGEPAEQQREGEAPEDDAPPVWRGEEGAGRAAAE